MANYQLPNDTVRTFHGALGNMTRGGGLVSNPGATFTAVVTPPGVNVVIDNATGDVTVNSIAPNQTGISVVFSESGGLPEADSPPWLVDTVDDVVPSQVAFNPAVAITDTPQAVPTQAAPATPATGAPPAAPPQAPPPTP